MLKGLKVGLRPLQSEDAWVLLKWFNDPQATSGLGIRDLQPNISLEQMVLEVQSKLTRHDIRPYLIWSLEMDGPIGLAELSHIDHRNANAKLFVLIGERDHIKGDFDQDATSLLLRIAFDQMNLHRVYSNIAFNDSRAMDRLFRLGFKSEGFLREDHFTAGSYHDSHVMGLLSSEFRRD